MLKKLAEAAPKKKTRAKAAVDRTAGVSEETVINFPTSDDDTHSIVDLITMAVRRYGMSFSHFRDPASSALMGADASELKILLDNSKAMHGLSVFAIPQETIAAVPTYDQRVYDELSEAQEMILKLEGLASTDDYAMFVTEQAAQHNPVSYYDARRTATHRQCLEGVEKIYKEHTELLEKMSYKAVALSELVSMCLDFTSFTSYERGLSAPLNFASVMFTVVGSYMDEHMLARALSPLSRVSPLADSMTNMFGALRHLRSPALATVVSLDQGSDRNQVGTPILNNVGNLWLIGEEGLKTPRAQSRTSTAKVLPFATSGVPAQIYVLKLVAEAMRRTASYVVQGIDLGYLPSPLTLTAALYTAEPDFDPTKFDHSKTGIILAEALSELCVAASQLVVATHIALQEAVGVAAEGAHDSAWDEAMPGLVLHGIRRTLNSIGSLAVVATSLAFAPPVVDTFHMLDPMHDPYRVDPSVTYGVVGYHWLRPGGNSILESWLTTPVRRSITIHAVIHQQLLTVMSGQAYLKFTRCVDTYSTNLSEFVPQLMPASVLSKRSYGLAQSAMYTELINLRLLTLAIHPVMCQLPEDVRKAHNLPRDIFRLTLSESGSEVHVPLIMCVDHNGFTCVLTPTHRETQKFFLENYRNGSAKAVNNFLSHAGGSTRRALLQPSSTSFQETLQDILKLTYTGGNNSPIRGQSGHGAVIAEYIDFAAYFQGSAEEEASEYNLFLKLTFGPDRDETARPDAWKFWASYVDLALMRAQTMGDLVNWDGNA